MDKEVHDQILAEVNELKEVCRRVGLFKIESAWLQMIGKSEGTGRNRYHIRVVWGGQPTNEALIKAFGGEKGKVVKKDIGFEVILS